MSKERELDDILKSLEQRKKEVNKNIEPIIPPKANIQDDLLWIDNDDIKKKLNTNDDVLEPPKIYNAKEQVDNQSVTPEETQGIGKKEKKSKKEKPSKKGKKEKAPKEPFVLTFPKLLAIVISVFVVICIVVGSILYCYNNKLYMFADSDTGYSYQTDIDKEYKVRYEQNNAFCGEIIIDDLSIKEPIFSQKTDNSPYFYSGADITKPHQIMSLDLSDSGLALENIYSRGDMYTKAGQKIVIKTLFEKKTFKVIGSYYTNKKPDDNFGYVFPYNINGTLTKQNFADYRDNVKKRFLYNTGYDIMYDDEILNICINSNKLMPNYKFVIVCVEADKVEQTKIIKANEKPYYPQSYYDMKGYENPFKYALGNSYFPKLTLDENEKETVDIKQDDYIEK